MMDTARKTMRIKRHSLKLAATSVAGVITLLGPISLSAAPGTLSDSPMFLTNPVEPNILFVVDDSWSMDWTLMTNEDSGIINLGCPYYYTHPSADNNEFWVVPVEATLRAAGVAAPYGGVWRAWNSNYNRVYYDPTITYVPWPGENSGGVAFADVNPIAAPLDPQISGGETVNLTATSTYRTDYCAGDLGTVTVTDFFPARYQQWKDSNLDGVVDGQDFMKWNSAKFKSSLLWSEGNFNGDGVIDGRDLLAWNANKFMSSDHVPVVPEPAAAAAQPPQALPAADALHAGGGALGGRLSGAQPDGAAHDAWRDRGAH